MRPYPLHMVNVNGLKKEMNKNHILNSNLLTKGAKYFYIYT